MCGANREMFSGEEMEFSTLFWFSFYAFFFFISSVIGYQKGHFIAGVLLGYVLGPIGALLMYFSKDKKHIACGSCQAEIHHKSYYCPKCNAQVLGRAKQESMSHINLDK